MMESEGWTNPQVLPNSQQNVISQGFVYRYEYMTAILRVLPLQLETEYSHTKFYTSNFFWGSLILFLFLKTEKIYYTVDFSWLQNLTVLWTEDV